ncbi:MAG: SDR family oxidoreductase, partial [Proteobacteria bacterium]|nr:SDR family oxidoreductase [Pseudomonadota bacterium]
NIRVNCISPGFIDTKMTKSINEEFKKKLVENIPMGKLGNGNDIANCAIFLASDLSSYITGETIHVNGGMYMA